MRYIYLLLLMLSQAIVQKISAQTYCDSNATQICYSIVTDTAFNPYMTGALGNWRSQKSFTYYGQRALADTATATNIRVNGTIEDFNPYWTFNSGVLEVQGDTNRWVWNSEITQFNPKGFEIENKDPLGRYNAGLYGYNLTLPIAVIQNSRVRESGFDGFEDYTFMTQTCDTACAPSKHFGFSAFATRLDATVKHTGKYSFRLQGIDDVGLTYEVVSLAQDTAATQMTLTTMADACCTGGTVLKAVKTNSSILLPAFSPLKGKKMLISAWVKEAQPCACMTYVKNQITINFDGGGTTLTFLPTGNIIEGWQRYESVFAIPSASTTLTVTLKSTDASTTVNFDDIRILPFNANMKSFVYSPVNLRLMAELDENNYATFYEYDDDGTLTRVKKETERGIQTIKETRSALIKQ